MKQVYPEPKYLSVPDAAKFCGVSRNTVYTWVRKGKLGAYQTPGKTNLIRPSDLVKFMGVSGLFIPAALSDLGREDEKLLGQASTPPSQSAPHFEHPDLHVLAVDDDALTRSYYARVLQGFTPLLLAGTGFEALHLIATQPEISVVLLDLRMPGQHGMKTYREIRQLRSNLPVLVVSGFSEDWMPGLVGGLVDMIKKPFDGPQLRAAILSAVAKA